MGTEILDFGRCQMKKISLIEFLCLFFSVFILSSCKDTPTSPDQPTVYYKIEITYIRENILSPERPDDIYCYIARANWNSSLPYTEEMLEGSEYFTKIDEYTFTSLISYSIASNEGGNPHKICFMDLKRWDGVDEGSVTVGSRIILKVVDTGDVLELKDITKCDIGICPYKTDVSRMAIFWITGDGKLKNYK